MDATSVINGDYAVFTWLNGFAGRSVWSDLLAVILAQGVIFLLLAGLVIFVMRSGRGRLRHAVEALIAAAFSRLVIISLIRLYLERPRPFAGHVVNVLIPEPFDASFPSSHTSIMFALGFSLLLTNRRWGVAYLILALLSGFARVVVGVHFPLDIFVGVLVGLISALTLRLLASYCQGKNIVQE